MIASPSSSSRRAFSGTPTTCPTRENTVPTKGSVCVHFSTMLRMIRGGSASRNIVAPISIPSSGNCPEWLETSSTRPSGTLSTPFTAVRK